MLTTITRRAAMAAVALGLGLGLVGSAHAAGTAYADFQSSPVSPGPTAVKTVLLLTYDSDAPLPLTLRTVTMIGLTGPAGVQFDNCGTPIPNSGGALSLSPGTHCFIEAPANGTVVGEAYVTDGTASTASITQFARVMIETRDANNNVLTHAELR